MNRDPASLNGYLALVRAAELSDQVLIGSTKEEDGYILAGAHSASGWCWCQPVVIRIPCSSGMAQGTHMDHSQINHRRTMDEEVLDDENPMGFSLDDRGTTYPNGQVCVGPQDRPAK